MKWEGRRQSSNVDDRRGMRGKGGLIAGGGIVGIIVVLLQLFGGETGQQVASVVNQVAGGNQTQQAVERVEFTAEQKKIGEFTATVLADTEDVWEKVFSQNGLSTYKKPTNRGHPSIASGMELWFLLLLLQIHLKHVSFWQLLPHEFTL